MQIIDIKENELKSTDYIKGILMICVVFYHSIALWRLDGWFNQPPVEPCMIFTIIAEWLNSFHIYAFVFVSGYIYSFIRYEKNGYNSFKTFIQNKVKRLLVPYIFVCLVWAIPFYRIFFTSEISSIVQKFLFGTGPAQLWFLLALIGVFVIIYMLPNKLLDNRLLTFICMLALLGIGIVTSEVIPNYFQIVNVLQLLIFFWLGMDFRKNDYKILRSTSTSALIIIETIAFAIFFYLQFQNGILYRCLSLCLRISLNIIGAFSAFIILSRISMRFKEKRVILFMSKYSFGIFLFHQQIVWVIVNWTNGQTTPFLIAILGFTASVVVGYFITKMLMMTRVTRNLIGSK